VKFSYLPVLNVVTVVGEGGLEGTALASLYPGDTGTRSPNPANRYQFAEYV